MELLPPVVGPVPTSSAGAYLRWLARRLRRPLALGVLTGVVWLVALALVPWALGRAIDSGVAGSADGVVPASLWLWCGVIAGLVVLAAGVGVLRHRYAVANWIGAALTTSTVVGHHITRSGTALPQQIPTGEVASTVIGDAVHVGDLYEVTPRLCGSVAAYAVVTVLLLRSSVVLGVVVAVGVPLVAALLALVVRPLTAVQTVQRAAAGRLTTLGADTVTGLRVLRGVGGERVFVQRYAQRSREVRDAGVKVAGVQSVLDALQVLLPGAFVVLVTWLGARFALSGRISVGELVAFYGYAAFLVQPLSTATEALEKAVRSRVAVRRVLGVLRLEPSTSDPERPLDPPPPGGALDDPASGVVARSGRLTALVCSDPDVTAAVASRLARLDDRAPQAARLGGVPLDALTVADVRRRVVLVDSEPRLFTGWLRSQLDPHRHRTDAEIVDALEVAAAADVLEAVGDGLDSEVSEGGRSLSGGQRQRVSLARGLLTEAEVLVLVEPTSAVDAHTEATVAGRLAAARRGRTTVLVTSSPLLLDHADEVLLLDAADGVVVARGRHRDLLPADGPAGRDYRDVVLRGEDDADDVDAPQEVTV